MQNISPDVEKQFEDVGKRLALLLASANLPEDVKQAWAVLIPQMSMTQMDRLAKALEGYVTTDEQNLLTALAEQIKQAQTKMAEQKKAAEQKAQNELAEIDAMLAEK